MTELRELMKKHGASLEISGGWDGEIEAEFEIEYEGEDGYKKWEYVELPRFMSGIKL